MPTLILTPKHTEDSQALWRAAIEAGWGVHRLARWEVSADEARLPDPVLYVDSLFGPGIADAFGVRLLDTADGWLATLPIEYRRREIHLSNLGAARRRLVGEAFVKPPNDKSFAAAVYTAETLPAHLPDETPVLVSEIVKFEVEYRFFIADGDWRTGSVYARDGVLSVGGSEPSEATFAGMFVNRLLDDNRVKLPRAIALDVGLIQGEGWAVVEANGAWGSGLYDCDPIAALGVIELATVL